MERTKVHRYLLVIVCLLIGTTSGFTQINLESVVKGAFGPMDRRHFDLIRLDSSTYRYVSINMYSNEIRLYHLNHSLSEVIQFPDTFIASYNRGQISHISTELFDCDTSTIEYVFQFRENDDAAPTTTIYRTDGTVISQHDSASFADTFEGVLLYEPYRSPSSGIVNSPNGAKMILKHSNNSALIFGLCGELYSVEREQSDYSNLPAYPNPTTDYIIIPYDMQRSDGEGTLVLSTTSGQFVKSFRIDGQFSELVIRTTSLASGSYVYRIMYDDGTSSSNRFIKVGR